MKTACSLAALILISGSLAMAEEKIEFGKLPLPAGLVGTEVKATAAATVCFLEGPAVDRQGNIYFSDIAGNRILRLAANGSLSVFRADSGRTNGNAVDARNGLVSCEGGEMGTGGRRRMVRTDLATGEMTVLTERYEGKRYNSPNDCCVDSRGRVWFTDPRYSPDRSDLEMTLEGVYRIDTNGTVTRVLAQPDIQRPNGIAVNEDATKLYVIDSHPQVGGNRKIWEFNLSPEGVPSGQRLVFDFGKGRGGDGMRLDSQGNLWVAAGIITPRGEGETRDVPPGIYVITPQGKLLGRIPVNEDLITNLQFAGPDRKTVYVTAGKTLYKFPVQVAGPGASP